MDFAEEDCAAGFDRLGFAALVLFGPFDNIEIVASRKTLAQSRPIVLRRIRLAPKDSWEQYLQRSCKYKHSKVTPAFHRLARARKNGKEVRASADTRGMPGMPALRGCATVRVPMRDGKKDRYKRN